MTLLKELSMRRQTRLKLPSKRKKKKKTLSRTRLIWFDLHADRIGSGLTAFLVLVGTSHPIGSWLHVFLCFTLFTVIKAFYSFFLFHQSISRYW